MLRRIRSARRRRRETRSRKVQLQKLEPRNLLAANLGVTPFDTGEFMLGTVAVTPVLFESNGAIDPQTQNWTPEEIDEVLAKVDEGVHWWSDTLDTLDTVHTLDFVIDDTYAVDPVETAYEPIDRASSEFNRYVGDWVTSLGYGDSNSIEEAVQRFNHAQRERLQTDWAFTIFVVDSSDDPDGLFASGGFAAAFAFAGGLFIVTPSTRPASTIAHEMGHIFWARDEYSGGGSWTDTRGYYNAQNLNAFDNPTPGFDQQISIMRGGVPLNAAYEAHVSPESTFAMVGWRDSDGDGVFDLADVPLEMDAIGYFDPESSLYHFAGTASAVPMINQNSAGMQSDITFNRVSELQYRLDDGPWIVAARPDQQQAEFDLVLSLDQAFSTIQWRARDASTGVTSEIIDGTTTLPALTSAGVRGIAFLDENSDGLPNASEQALSGVEVVLRNTDRSELFGGEVDAANFPDGALPESLTGVSVAAEGFEIDPSVGSFESADAGDERVFHAFEKQRNRWIDRWSEKAAFEASFDQAVGEVRLDAIGLGDLSYARLEAFDEAGNMLARATSEQLGNGQSVTLTVSDPEGRIRSIRAMGHADTAVALRHLRFGFQTTLTTSATGTLQLPNLPDGEYVVDLVPERLIHQFNESSVNVVVNAGTSEFVIAPAQRVNSPRFNELLAEDANRNGSVTSADALVIINDLDRNQPRVLQAWETDGFSIDVNNDGAVSAIDALLVINAISRAESENGGSGEAESAFSAGPSSTDAGPDQPTAFQTENRRLFDSAGGAASDGGVAPDESADHPNADTTDQPLVGPWSLNQKNSKNPANFVNKATHTTISERIEPEKAMEGGESFSPIKAEISEPF